MNEEIVEMKRRLLSMKDIFFERKESNTVILIRGKENKRFKIEIA